MLWVKRLVVLGVVGAAGWLAWAAKRSFDDPMQALADNASAVTTTYATVGDHTTIARQIVLPRTTVAAADKIVAKGLGAEGWNRTAMRGGDVSFQKAQGMIQTIELRSRRIDGKPAVIVFEYGTLAPWQKFWLWLRHKGDDPAAKPGGYVETSAPNPEKIEAPPERNDYFKG